MTDLPIIDDATWARMSWHARQDWLKAANGLRQLIRSDIERLLNTEARIASNRRAFREVHGDTRADAQKLLDHLGPDQHGPERLQALDIHAQTVAAKRKAQP